MSGGGTAVVELEKAKQQFVQTMTGLEGALATWVEAIDVVGVAVGSSSAAGRETAGALGRWQIREDLAADLNRVAADGQDVAGKLADLHTHAGAIKEAARNVERRVGAATPKVTSWRNALKKVRDAITIWPEQSRGVAGLAEAYSSILDRTHWVFDEISKRIAGTRKFGSSPFVADARFSARMSRDAALRSETKISRIDHEVNN